MSGQRRKCADCGVTDFLEPIAVRCIVCDPINRCLACHEAHSEHVGVELVQRGKAGPAYVRAGRRAKKAA